MKLPEIYQTLFAGKKIALEFPNEAEVLTFRSSLFRFKAQQDQVLSATGLIEEPSKLIFRYAKDLAATWRVTIYFQERNAKQYTVTILPDPDDEEEALELTE